MTTDRVKVRVAAAAVGRHISRLYAWIRDERLTVWEDDAGVIYVSLAEVRELEGRMFKRRNNRTTHRPAA